MAFNINANRISYFWALFLLILFSLSGVNLSLYLISEASQPSEAIILSPKTSLKMYAYISGAVINPGVYEVNENTRLIDLIYLAGGFEQEEADITNINQTLNLSQKVFNEDHIYIPFQTNSDESETAAETPADQLININTATISELDKLPGVGPATAEKIIGSRPYKSIEEIANVSGIGEKKYLEIKKLITI